MNKLKEGILKEFLLLINDKVGLSMMIFLPVLLVIIITSIQNSAFNIVNNNQIEIIIANQDEDSLSIQLIESLEESKLFKIKKNDLSEDQLNNKINNSETPFGLYIPKDYSAQIKSNSTKQIDNLKYSMGILDSINGKNTNQNHIPLTIYYSPVIQPNYAQSINQMVFTLNKKLSTNYMLTHLASELGLGEGLFNIENQSENKELVLKKSSFNKNDTTIPNASQHNVPAWSIFAVFFMVISLAGNFVKEKINGSFDRVLTMPTSIWYLITSKAILFLIVSLFQILLIFTISRFLFHLIDLPTLYFPENIFSFIWVILLTGFTAVSYSLLVGIYSKTVEQANGFGALSIIIFSAIGGIWVPSFIMPPFLKLVSNISPLHWCIELFYTVFLKNGSFNELLFPSFILLIMNLVFIIFAYFKLKRIIS